jgi:hypothetical protein
MQHNQQEHCYINNISLLLPVGDHYNDTLWAENNHKKKMVIQI